MPRCPVKDAHFGEAALAEIRRREVGERGVRWNDPCFAINWPAEPLVISDKDRSQRDFDPAWHLEAPPPSPPPLAGEG